MTNNDRIAVRLPAELRQWIEQQAETEDRSISNYVVILLKRAKEQTEVASGSPNGTRPQLTR